MKRKILPVIAFALLLCVLLSSCGNRVVLNADSFKSKLEKSSLNFYDKTNEWSSVYKKLVSVQSASSQSGTYEILFYTFEKSSSARMAFDKMTASASSAAKTSDGGNYITVVDETSTAYHYTTCVGETVLDINVSPTYKEEVRSIIKALGY